MNIKDQIERVLKEFEDELVNQYHEFSKDSRYPVEFAENLINKALNKGKNLKTWRDELISHKGRDIALGEKSAGEIIPGDIADFYNLMKEYIEAVSQSFGKGPFPIETVAYFGVSDLIKALKNAAVFKELFEKDPVSYDAALRRNQYRDA